MFCVFFPSCCIFSYDFITFTASTCICGLPRWLWGKESACQCRRETRVGCLGQEDPLEEEMAAHSSILVWEIPWTEEPGGLQSMELPGVRHDWACMHITHLYIMVAQESLKRSLHWRKISCIRAVATHWDHLGPWSSSLAVHWITARAFRSSRGSICPETCDFKLSVTAL